LVTAFTVINLANILASLMSLGAIDFGIVGDSIVMTKAILQVREAKPDEPHTGRYSLSSGQAEIDRKLD
jgi:Cu/Ag efflux pump CusA